MYGRFWLWCFYSEGKKTNYLYLFSFPGQYVISISGYFQAHNTYIARLFIQSIVHMAQCFLEKPERNLDVDPTYRELFAVGDILSMCNQGSIESVREQNELWEMKV